MMTAVVEQKPSHKLEIAKPQVPPSVLLIGKKRTLDYVAPALYRINNTGDLVIKATGSLSIVTAVDVAEIVKRDVPDIKTQSITLGTDMLKVATGELKPMSCIEIHLIKYNPIAVVQHEVRPEVDVHVPVEQVASPVIEIPIEEATSPVEAEVPVIVAEKAKKPRSKRKTAAKKKTATKRKKKPAAASP